MGKIESFLDWMRVLFLICLKKQIKKLEKFNFFG